MDYNFNNIAAILPVREGSTRIKDKVVLSFTRELNLLEWKIDQLKKVLPASNIFVSTDSNKLQQIAIERGVQIHKRNPYLCKGHHASFSEVITGIVNDIPFEHIAWITVVVPLMSPLDYLSSFKSYIKFVVEERKYDSLVATNLLKEYLWDDKGPINYKADKNHTISQDLPNIYKVTNGLYMMPKDEILKHEYFLGKNPYKQVVSKMAGIDIDEWEDYELSLAMLQFYDDKNEIENTKTQIYT